MKKNIFEDENIIEKEIINYLFFRKNCEKKDNLIEEKKILQKIKEEINNYEELIKECKDEKDIKIIYFEKNNLIKKRKKIIEGIKLKIIQDENNEENIIVEIRPGTGGNEASLFVQDLYLMYQEFAKKKKWLFKEIKNEEDFKSFLLKGKNIFVWISKESGIHRVQRIPKTENRGRMHTSTVTVVIFPELKKTNLKINFKDLKIDTYRSSGAGGQHVNTTDSAVRITHLPTGIIATSQDERSQHDNKQKALSVLNNRILSEIEKKTSEKNSILRSSIIKNSERSKKIRTYNYLQNRITDHRLEISWKNLNSIIKEGKLEKICYLLINYTVLEKIKKN